MATGDKVPRLGSREVGAISGRSPRWPDLPKMATLEEGEGGRIARSGAKMAA